MPAVSPELVLQVMTILATGAAMYGAIRADLKGLHQRVGRAEKDIEHARERMDNHIERIHS